MVIFNLPYAEESEKALNFLSEGEKTLTQISVVRNFQVFRQVSEKNGFQYGFSMIFDNSDNYQSYNIHPNHVAFVQNRWLKEVTDFLEIDFEV